MFTSTTPYGSTIVHVHAANNFDALIAVAAKLKVTGRPMEHYCMPAASISSGAEGSPLLIAGDDPSEDGTYHVEVLRYEYARHYHW